ncbi:hypothetical protein HY504_00705 [Candidatus Wolfebacteria bacterium]|nr:hypothetical protein [Candidatus Wolfebacteria bacterium]
MLYRIDEIQLKKPTIWDKKWRLIMFDIPHNKKASRDALRAKLRQLDFYPLQKSVFVTPYPCEDEIDFIGSVFGVRSHILILSLPTFSEDGTWQNYFNLKKL